MNILLHFMGLTLFYIIEIDANVFIQLRKGENNSNFDTLTHKVLPNAPLNSEYSRRSFSNPKRSELLARPRWERSEGLESVVVAINTGAVPNKPETNFRSYGMQNILDMIIDFFKNHKVSALFKSKKEAYNIKPEIVHFRSGKPSLMLELDFKSIMLALKDMLRSRKVKQYTDKLAQKAAMVYRALKEDKTDRVNRNEYIAY